LKFFELACSEWLITQAHVDIQSRHTQMVVVTMPVWWRLAVAVW